MMCLALVLAPGVRTFNVGAFERACHSNDVAGSNGRGVRMICALVNICWMFYAMWWKERCGTFRLVRGRTRGKRRRLAAVEWPLGV